MVFDGEGRPVVAVLRPARRPTGAEARGFLRCLVRAIRGHWPRVAITRTITKLREALRKSLTWDQGAEMSEHARLRIGAGVAVYFCDPHSPWQRGTNENTDGLLRQYFPKGTDLSVHSDDELAAVAAALNGRPRKSLNWSTPAEALDEALRMAQRGVATTS